MNEGTTQTVEIDIKDLFCYIFKHATALLVVAVIFGIAGAGFSYVKQKKAISAPVANILDTTVKQPGESDEAYNNRVANVERANDIMDNIAVLTKQVEIQNDYISNSVYMQIDPLNTASTKIQVVITCDSSKVGGLESLYGAYQNDIKSGEYLDSTAESMGANLGAIQELISCGFDSSDSVYTDGTKQMGIITIVVIGRTIDETDYIMNAIESEIESKKADFDSSIATHTLSVIGRQSSVGYDSGVRKNQLDSVSTLNTLQTQINNLNTNLDSIAKSLGLTDRTDFYKSYNEVATTENSVQIKTCIKYGLIGLVLGMVLVAGLLALVYVFGRRLITQTQFFSISGGVDCIGVCKPLDKRNKLQTALDCLTNDDSFLTEESTNKIISANLSNLMKPTKRVLITSTIDSDEIKESIKGLGINADVKLDMFSNPSVLQSVSEYDGIVIIEQRGVSGKKAIKEQIRLLKNSGTKIIGAIIL